MIYFFSVPSPPPAVGGYLFPTDFPRPRPFERGARQYTSGRTRGSDFDLKVL
jgi:hypothetical protein